MSGQDPFSPVMPGSQGNQAVPAPNPSGFGPVTFHQEFAGPSNPHIFVFQHPGQYHLHVHESRGYNLGPPTTAVATAPVSRATGIQPTSAPYFTGSTGRDVTGTKATSPFLFEGKVVSANLQGAKNN